MAESIFPFFNDFTIQDKTAQYPLYKEVAWDFERNIPIFQGLRPKYVTGNEAIKVWCFKALKTPRFKYEMYSWDFGGQLEKMIGKNYQPKVIKAEVTRVIEETLLINPYIKNVSQISTSFKNGELTVNCTINTIYGTEKISL